MQFTPFPLTVSAEIYNDVTEHIWQLCGSFAVLRRWNCRWFWLFSVLTCLGLNRMAAGLQMRYILMSLSTYEQLGCKAWLHNYLWRWNFRLIFMLLLGKLRPEQNDWCFPGDIFKCIFMNEKSWIVNKISLDYVCKCLRDNTINQWLGLKLGHAVAQAVWGHVNSWTNDDLFHRCIHVLPFLTHCVPGRSILYFLYPSPMKLRGYSGFTLSVRLSICLSVCNSVDRIVSALYLPQY